MAGRGLLRVACTLVRPASVRTYAKKPVVKSKGKGAVKEVLKGPELCRDPVILTTHAVGANIFKTGPDVKLKEDSEYPEWLFHLELGPPKKLEELSPETPQYWRLLRKMHIWRNNRLDKTKKL
ncbi:hypothetical protein XENTR_v10001167 [Xenopus tropicalis]|uniref:Large ribosomal subunit protein mL54 n=1 Tax=Xenopus tropicalis TaxID=8364 RepID=A0A6I8PUR7_XENTR|nr:39S ribosomal protein L54, mitochondrial [Xenopus tropicalis]KAE8631362.1 hypothetical protein XENTR_v10001167 [Xenopus tropicalis]|eukprot:XP_002941437.1 PREDICTED: 39S ribosomal protein L54, mitochondrial [Xenopus tropicalis]